MNFQIIAAFGIAGFFLVLGFVLGYMVCGMLTTSSRFADFLTIAHTARLKEDLQTEIRQTAIAYALAGIGVPHDEPTPEETVFPYTRAPECTCQRNREIGVFLCPVHDWTRLN